MDNDTIISVKNLTKTYPLYNSHADRVKETFHPFRKKYHRPFNALNDISFEVRRGETLGVIGRNGSGKSTLLQTLCGILIPTSGTLTVNGRVSSLLELGAGFNSEFTGRQNVYLNGAILGWKPEKIEAHFDEIAAFADIGEFIDQPVKTYSSGMYVRLAFAAHACLDPEVLIVDEVLSVGDFFFQQKCHARMQSLLEGRTAIVLVSHDMVAIEKYSTQVMLLDQGHCLFLGQPNEAVERYYQIEHSQRQDTEPNQCHYDSEIDPNGGLCETDVIDDWPPKSAFLDLSKATVIGEKDIARCNGVAVCNDKGQPCTSFQMGDVAYFYFEFEFLKDSDVPVGGVVITNKMNVNIHGKNSLQYFVKAPRFTTKGTRVRFRQTIHLDIESGEYAFQVGLAAINAGDYARVTEMDFVQLTEKLRVILRVRQIGIISVFRIKKGLAIPFYGYADLRGECTLSVLDQNES